MVSLTRKLSRNSAHRQMLMRIMVTNLVREEQIRTTVAKAKEVRRHADRMISIAKRGGHHAWKQIFAFVTDKDVARKVFKVLLPRFIERQGGYTRLLRAGTREGDKSEMAILEYLQPEHEPLAKLRPKNEFMAPWFVRSHAEQPIDLSQNKPRSKSNVILPSSPSL